MVHPAHGVREGTAARLRVDHVPVSVRRIGRSASVSRRWRTGFGGGVGPGNGTVSVVIPLGSESLMIVRSAWPYCLCSGPTV